MRIGSTTKVLEERKLMTTQSQNVSAAPDWFYSPLGAKIHSGQTTMPGLLAVMIMQSEAVVKIQDAVFEKCMITACD